MTLSLKVITLTRDDNSIYRLFTRRFSYGHKSTLEFNIAFYLLCESFRVNLNDVMLVPIIERMFLFVKYQQHGSNIA